MGSVHPSLRQHQRHVEPRQHGHADVDVEALVEENAELQENCDSVIQTRYQKCCGSEIGRLSWRLLSFRCDVR